MKDLYKRLGLSLGASTAAIEAAIERVSDQSLRRAARSVLLTDRRREYDLVHTQLTRIAQLRANLGIANTKLWNESNSSDFAAEPSKASSQLDLLKQRVSAGRHGGSDSSTSGLNAVAKGYFRIAVLAGVLVLIAFIFTDRRPLENGTQKSNNNRKVQESFRLQYIRPAVAPNGETWPSTPSYLSGVPQLNRQGHSSVTIDNTRNDADVFVKLVYLDRIDEPKVRQVFIPSGGKFKMESISVGSYDVRYQDLSSGAFMKSRSFELTETRQSGGIEYTEYTMTLYRVSGGNTTHQTITASDFE